MTEEQLQALLVAASAKPGDDGWHVTPDDQTMTLYVASNGASLTVGKIHAIRLQGDVLMAKTRRDEHYVVQRSQVFAGVADPPSSNKRTAGFA